MSNPLKDSRFLRTAGLALGVSLALALAYTTTGIGLNQAENFVKIDRFAFTIAFLVGSLVILGYFLRTRDFTETIGLSLILTFSLLSGFEDVLVYLLLGRPVPDQLPWLNDTHIGEIAGFLGFEAVTREALFTVVVVTGFAAYLAVVFLYDVEEGVL